MQSNVHKSFCVNIAVAIEVQWLCMRKDILLFVSPRYCCSAMLGAYKRAAEVAEGYVATWKTLRESTKNL